MDVNLSLNLSQFFPPEAMLWMTRYGLFSSVILLLALALLLLFRPFWLWYSGKSELLDRMKRMEDHSQKALFELEMLNKTLSIPVRKAAQRPKPAEAEEAAMVVSQETKDSFLRVLEQSRSRVLDDAGEGLPPEPRN